MAVSENDIPWRWPADRGGSMGLGLGVVLSAPSRFRAPRVWIHFPDCTLETVER